VNEQIDIAVIRARVAAATPGPWVRGIARDDDGWAVLANDGDDEVCTQPPSRVIDPYSPADADLIAHAPADIAALCDEVERLRAELDDARNVALGAVEDCAGLRASLEEISEASIDLIAAGDKLRASNERLRNVVELDEAIYLDLARAAGFDHEPPSDARQCIAVVKAMATERDALRAVIAGRTTTPTGAEVDAHPGAFLWMRCSRLKVYGL